MRAVVSSLTGVARLIGPKYGQVFVGRLGFGMPAAASSEDSMVEGELFDATWAWILGWGVLAAYLTSRQLARQSQTVW